MSLNHAATANVTQLRTRNNRHLRDVRLPFEADAKLTTNNVVLDCEFSGDERPGMFQEIPLAGWIFYTTVGVIAVVLGYLSVATPSLF